MAEKDAEKALLMDEPAAEKGPTVVSAPDPNEIIDAVRVADWPVTSYDYGIINPGDTMPMRRAEAENRDDFEVVEGTVATKQSPGKATKRGLADASSDLP